MTSLPHPDRELADTLRRHAADYPKLKMVVAEWSDEERADQAAYGEAYERLKRLLAATHCVGLRKLAALAVGNRDVYLYADPYADGCESATAFLDLCQHAAGQLYGPGTVAEQTWWQAVIGQAEKAQLWTAHDRIPGCQFLVVPGPAALTATLTLESLAEAGGGQPANGNGHAEAAGDAETPPWRVGTTKQRLAALTHEKPECVDWTLKELAEEIERCRQAVWDSKWYQMVRENRELVNKNRIEHMSDDEYYKGGLQ